MWWFSPAVSIAGQIPGTELTETYLGRSWQRWSRHFQPGQWQTGIDGIESFLALISCELDRWAKAAA
jgi:Prokaryotic E2 family E